MVADFWNSSVQESQQARWLVPDSAKHVVTLDGEAFWSSIEAWERVSINSLEADGARDAAIIGKTKCGNILKSAHAALLVDHGSHRVDQVCSQLRIPAGHLRINDTIQSAHGEQQVNAFMAPVREVNFKLPLSNFLS